MSSQEPDVALPTAFSIVPRVILEAGSETLTDLGDLLQRRFGEMAADQVLEVISSEPSTRDALPVWCEKAGHHLLYVFPDGASTRFWIRKAGGDSS